MKTVTAFLVVILFISCHNKNPPKEHLGEVRINVSGASEAKVEFEKGLLLLHSFEYEDAREAFQNAQRIDADMPMAYWGEAMTYNHSLWSEQEYDKASAVLGKLLATDYQANSTELEQDLIRAVQILYKAESKKNDRDLEYSQFMESLTQKYPDNHEVAAFYALSLLGSVPEGRDETLYGQGAEIAQGILNENPNHPGALHYLIHSYDDPDHATLALDAAHAYAKVAPDASHALHMPSHIFVAMGMWDEVVASNIDSYQASLTRMREKGLDNDARGYHAFHWLQYGYLQKGNTKKAAKMLREMEQYTNETPSKRARIHLIFMKGTYLVDTNDWNSAFADIAVENRDLNISIRSQYHFLEGMKAYVNGNTRPLDSLIKVASNDIERGNFVVKVGADNFCSNVARGDLTQTDLTEVEIRKLQLQALLADLKNDLAQAESYFKESIALEESLSYSYGPPFIQKPTHELYADWLLNKGRNQEAQAQYEKMLKRAPKRKLALHGIEKATI